LPESNARLEDRFGAAEEAAVAANDYEKLADLHKRANQLERSFYAAVRQLSERVPDRDKSGLRRYLALSHELDVFDRRVIRALRAHDDEELARLITLSERVRNQRTRVTARMGLRECGA
jgi:hypothetical protein